MNECGREGEYKGKNGKEREQEEGLRISEGERGEEERVSDCGREGKYKRRKEYKGNREGKGRVVGKHHLIITCMVEMRRVTLPYSSTLAHPPHGRHCGWGEGRERGGSGCVRVPYFLYFLCMVFHLFF